jgi:DNA-directed RNA polymerase subunit RPC12/RpoP
MQGFELMPNNCSACGYWTATELSRTQSGWLLRCTHCGGKVYGRGGERSFRAFSEAMVRFRQKAQIHFPVFSKLAVRGGHLALSSISPVEEELRVVPNVSATVGLHASRGDRSCSLKDRRETSDLCRGL